MPVTLRSQRVKHVNHPEWGVGEIFDERHHSGLGVFFEWIGERFTLKPDALRLLGHPESESTILDALRIHGNSQANHSVYVVELEFTVWRFSKFRRQNPCYQHHKSCIYVGCTGRTVEDRLRVHKFGTSKYNAYVRYYGTKLLYDLFFELNPRRYEVALATEFAFAHKLRLDGYAVYQN
jgi:hypothetical protein